MTNSLSSWRPSSPCAPREPDPLSCELTLTQLRDGVTVERVREATGWDLAVAGELRVTEPASEAELDALRELVAR
jgi:glutaconate CoA-transferase subunit B